MKTYQCGIFRLAGLFCTSLILGSCSSGADDRSQAGRTFSTSFESVSDFDGFYIVPQGDYDSSHDLSTEEVFEGTYSHKAWVINARAADNNGTGVSYLPHRAYPTVQLYKTSQGGFSTPCLITLWVYLDMTLTDRPAGSVDDWFSFATLSPDTSDYWIRTVVVNVGPDGYMRLVHVPDQGEQDYIYQVSAVNDPGGTLLYPQREWVRLDIYIDFSSENGYAKVWQNRQLVSYALVNGGNGTLEQTHFGLYSSAAISSGSIYNDELTIREVTSESKALEYINP